EKLVLQDAVGENVLSFDYNDGWFSPTDGAGYTLEILDEGGVLEGWDKADGWGISLGVDGTPGSGAIGKSMHFDSYLVYGYTGTERDDPLITGAEVDLDGDGLGLFLEYALVRDPAVADATEAFEGVLGSEGGEERLEVRFRRPQNVIDVSYGMEVSADLQGWSPGAGVSKSVVDLGNGSEEVVLGLPVGSAGERHAFVRLRITGR
ncbi:MAG: hypothetical protein P8J87_18765, partial [Verrucomicrobiales bacterium]|nr:hypothetical protein [Verrucomicrobiales bacterium]